jgi:hypothetical protein
VQADNFIPYTYLTLSEDWGSLAVSYVFDPNTYVLLINLSIHSIQIAKVSTVHVIVAAILIIIDISSIWFSTLISLC